MYPAFFILLRSPKGYRAANRLRQLWACLLFLLTGIVPVITYRAQIDRRRNYVFCSNHFSYLDIPLAALVAGPSWRFLAKAELNNIPLLNIFFRTVDISVDRENAWESFQSYQESLRSVDHGLNLVVFPEGRISPKAPQLFPFKNGPFRLAIEKQVPIVPLTMLDNWRLLRVEGWRIEGRPGVARIIVHEPIETQGLTPADAPQLRQRVFDLLAHDLKQANPQIRL
ncbi:MAG: lysophospholipid acyltransferase family protein [Chitinophagales bacterium]|nr:1-acyl-sn-glycerol-3-phosphate acyltransferase [Chitinophagales bacterium]MDW8392810.1 lysophospholipid acyltransferase family protein [Chitinophagales bacterium]